jgi:molybdenum cofactor synthesis domain-containing protein
MMFRKLLTFEDAQRAVQKQFKPKPLGTEQVPLLEAADRVLAEDTRALLDIPPFNRSTVDGFAVTAEDTFGAQENKPVALKICGVINIGETPKPKVGHGKAAEIVTGAPIPQGADAVVMVENTERKKDNLFIFSPVAKDENIMKAGTDIKKGEKVLKTGQILGSTEIGVLSALGISKVKVYTIPRVAVLSTGPELTEPGMLLASAKIYDINAYSLSTAVLESGGKPLCLGVFPDSLTELCKALRRALASADMVVTSGGVSVGPKDIVPKALDSLGKPSVIVCGIAIKPGKPTTVALINGKLVVALPGHPTSALLVFNLLVRPIIRRLGARNTDEDQTVEASAASRMFTAKGRQTFVMVKLKYDKANRLVAEPIPSGASGAITTLARADGFVEIAGNIQFIDKGEAVDVHLFRKCKKGMR